MAGPTYKTPPFGSMARPSTAANDYTFAQPRLTKEALAQKSNNLIGRQMSKEEQRLSVVFQQQSRSSGIPNSSPPMELTKRSRTVPAMWRPSVSGGIEPFDPHNISSVPLKTAGHDPGDDNSNRPGANSQIRVDPSAYIHELISTIARHQKTIGVDLVNAVTSLRKQAEELMIQAAMRRDITAPLRQLHNDFYQNVLGTTPPEIEFGTKQAAQTATVEKLETLTTEEIREERRTRRRRKSNTRPRRRTRPEGARARDLRPNVNAWDHFGKGSADFVAKQIVDPTKNEDGSPRQYGTTRSGKPIYLRDYQGEGNMTVQKKYGEGHDRGLVIMPPRVGKTLTAVSIATTLNEQYPETIGKKENKIIFIGGTNTICVQNYLALMDNFGVDEVGLVMGDWRDMNKRVISLSVNTWYGMTDDEKERLGLKNAGLIILDEAQHYTYGNENMGLLVEGGFVDLKGKPVYQPGRLLLGMTGTPERMSQAPLNTVYGPEGIWFEKDLNFYRNKGYLLKPRNHTKRFTKVSGLKHSLEAAIAPTDIIRKISPEDLALQIGFDIKTELQTETPGRYKKTIIFADGIEKSKTIAKELRAQGIRAAQVHSQMDFEELEALRLSLIELGANIPPFSTSSGIAHARQELLSASRKGEIDILVNDSMLIEGYDDPEILVVMLGRYIGSRSDYTQMTFRGATPSLNDPTLTHYDVYDYADNHDRFEVPLSYLVIYQAEQDGEARYFAENISPGDIKRRAKMKQSSITAGEAVTRNITARQIEIDYSPFQTAFNDLLMDLANSDLVPGDDRLANLERALLTVAKRISAHTMRSHLSTYYLIPYVDGSAIPFDYDSVVLLSQALKDEEGKLIGAWAHIRASILEVINPTQVVTSNDDRQSAWSGLVHDVRYHLFLKHGGILTRVCAPKLIPLFTNLLNGKLPDEDTWDALKETLVLLSSADGAQREIQTQEIIDTMKSIAEQTTEALSYFYHGKTGQTDKFGGTDTGEDTAML